MYSDAVLAVFPLLGIVSQDDDATGGGFPGGDQEEQEQAEPEPGPWREVQGTEGSLAEGAHESGGQIHSQGSWVAWG